MSDLFERFSDNLQVPLKSKRRMLNEFNDFCLFQFGHIWEWTFSQRCVWQTFNCFTFCIYPNRTRSHIPYSLANSRAAILVEIILVTSNLANNARLSTSFSTPKENMIINVH